MTDPTGSTPDRSRVPAPTEPVAQSAPPSAAETRPIQTSPADQLFPPAPPAPPGASGDQPTNPGYAPQGTASPGYPQPGFAGGPPPPPGTGGVPPKRRMGRPPVVAAVIGGVLVVMLAFAGGFAGGFFAGRISDGPGSSRFMMQGPGEMGRFGDRGGRDFGELGPRTDRGPGTSVGPNDSDSGT